MPVFNCAGTIAQAIASIQNQTFAEWELLIVDDGSTDSSGEIAVSFRDPRIVVKQGTANRGLPIRLNECVSLARGRFFARMDGDDIAYPERLQSQLDYLQSHDEVDLVGGWVVVFKGDGMAFGTRRAPLRHEQIAARPWNGFPMPHPTWMGRTEWFLRNPYSPDALRNEDQELLFRTYRSSRFANVPQIVLGYREDGLSLKKILRARMAMGRTMIRACRRPAMLPNAALGIAGVAAKGLTDTIAIGTGLGYSILRHRAGAIGAEEASEWRSVWEQAGQIAASAEYAARG
jgi:glycosyltransferase involved in cell wall biosynthesis